MAITSFYDPNQSYGNQAWNQLFPNWRQSEGFHTQVDLDPEGYWTRRLAESGFGGLDDRSSYARGLFGRAMEGLSAARLTNPGLRAVDYFDQLDLTGLTRQASPGVRGQSDRRFTSGFTTWGQRPY